MDEDPGIGGLIVAVIIIALILEAIAYALIAVGIVCLIVFLLYMLSVHLGSILGILAVTLILIIDLIKWVHHKLAYIFLYVIRNTIVSRWNPLTTGKWEHRLVIFWLFAAPLPVAIMTFGMITHILSNWIPMFVVIWISLSSTLLTMYYYFQIYFEEPPAHHTWPNFIKAEKGLWLDMRLWYIERKLQYRLWRLDRN